MFKVIKDQKIRWFGHILRKREGRMINDIMMQVEEMLRNPGITSGKSLLFIEIKNFEE